jgi:hypothetical protein
MMTAADRKNWIVYQRYCYKIGRLTPEQIAKLESAGFVFDNPMVWKKKRLLEMARSGQPRPPRGKKSLGTVLLEYTLPNNKNYDAEFDKEIRALRPDWFFLQYEKVAEKKRMLLEMARNGESRPSKDGSSLGRFLTSYTTQNRGGCYDLEFDREIRALRPDWFVSQTDQTVEYKRLLLDMARNNQTRPKQVDGGIGNALCRYTQKGNEGYDLEFDTEIRGLRPDWFMSKVDMAAEKKRLLIEMALRGDPRPLRKKHPFAMALGFYTNPKATAYDAEFDRKIRQLRPDWFSRSDMLRRAA